MFADKSKFGDVLRYTWLWMFVTQNSAVVCHPLKKLNRHK
ncbi:hypothetical protein AM1_5792 [Acaryochloris marina MBIC11017]|uniref:Uncharacterized protein n=1 Tax=Acaryochloris marina (strain MBIC 11017) TaxID=329726 RepID=B0BZJ2_ACAM1|nr:hypothetical protein AM1_5792 [Acaryochloris marina MBIC11017]